jgi:hypothetical protein
MEVDGPLGRGRSSSIFKRPHHVHSRKKIAKETSAMRRNAISIQTIVEQEGVLSGLVKLG